MAASRISEATQAVGNSRAAQARAWTTRPWAPSSAAWSSAAHGAASTSSSPLRPRCRAALRCTACRIWQTRRQCGERRGAGRSAAASTRRCSAWCRARSRRSRTRSRLGPRASSSRVRAPLLAAQLLHSGHAHASANGNWHMSAYMPSPCLPPWCAAAPWVWPAAPACRTDSCTACPAPLVSWVAPRARVPRGDAAASARAQAARSDWSRVWGCSSP